MSHAAPRFATPRDHSRSTLGHEVEHVANACGFTLSDWQREVVDVALELDEDGSLHYRRVVLSIGRQQGKTALLGFLHLWRLLYGRDRWGVQQLDLHTAQTRDMAARVVKYDWPRIIEGSSLDDYLTKHLTNNGHESMEFGYDRLVVTTPDHKGAHGYSGVGLATIDEVWSFQSSDVEQGMMPTQLAAVSPQLWLTSTAGESASRSPYWHGVLEHCRDHHDVDDDDCFFEWAAPDDADADDPATWALGCPAMGATITEKAIRALWRSMAPDDFARAILNRWTGAGSRLIPAQPWAACADLRASLLDSTERLWLAVDAAPSGEGTAGSLAVAGWGDDGLVHVQLIANSPGVDWLAQAIHDVTRKRKFQSLTFDDFGPVRRISADIRAASAARVEVIDAPTMGAACGRFLDAVVTQSMRYVPDPALNAAVDGAAKRQLLDSFAFSRRHASADLSPLVAATLAHWQAATHEKRPSFAIL